MKIKTNSGFECNIDVDVVTDMYFLRALRKSQKGDIDALFDLIEMLLGSEEQSEALYEHVKDENGHAPAEKVAEELGDIITKLEVDGESIGKNL